MRAFLLLLFFIFLPLFSVVAQHMDTLYLSKTRKIIYNKIEAAFFRITSYSNALKTDGIEKTFFITGEKESESSFLVERNNEYESRNYFGLSTNWYKNGQMKMQSNYVAGKKEGKEMHWYEDGQIYNLSYYTNGNKQGEAFTYYQDSKLKRQEIFNNNLLVEGKCFTNAGADTTYFPLEEMPVFPGGETALIKFIGKNIKYNKKALRQGI